MLTRIDLRGRRDTDLNAVLPRAELDVAAAVEQVRPVVAAVRDRGAEAVREATARFDGVTLTDLRVPAAALQQALEQLDPT
ncbi:MAG: histidinol dehydrogenase, partial [Mycobacteriales bacterium]